MSYDRREFLKTLTLGGIALFTADWTKLVEEAKAASAGKLLPALPGEKVDPKSDQIRAFWNDSSGYFELSDLCKEDDESEADFEARVQEAREEWESEQSSGREYRREEHEFDWYRRRCPGAQAVPYLQGLFGALEETAAVVDASDVADVGSIDFYDGACPGNDTYVAATAPDYETLAALQRVLEALKWDCRVVIVEPNPADEAKA